ncbi:MAG: hypothetical protein B6D61_02200 [Bacteroidetes bacterium 4484_249]|nr:MAG: hypothetical protein B6D61_02200 [Bacteroidetes bacterium 4484_249]
MGIRIILIGAGNVAVQLGKTLVKSGGEVIQVFSRTPASAQALAAGLKAGYTNEIGKIGNDADLYIISVADDAINGLTEEINFGKKPVVHTSGTVSMDVLNRVSENYGVFYPFQTFSKSRDVSFKNIPVCIEANNNTTLELLKKLAVSVSDKVYKISSEQRKVLHLAGVFACNFPNFMYSIAETAQKAQSVKPSEAQTGPAVRGDEKIIETHLDLLGQYPGFRDLYRIISSEIGRKRGGVGS